MDKEELLNLNYVDKRSLIRQGKYLDVFIKDKHWEIRKEVVKRRYRLDILINDNDPDVRMAVVRQGYRLDKLINDKNKYVRLEVIIYCKEHNNEEECRNLLRLYNL